MLVPVTEPEVVVLGVVLAPSTGVFTDPREFPVEDIPGVPAWVFTVVTDPGVLPLVDMVVGHEDLSKGILVYPLMVVV